LSVTIEFHLTLLLHAFIRSKTLPSSNMQTESTNPVLIITRNIALASALTI